LAVTALTSLGARFERVLHGVTQHAEADKSKNLAVTTLTSLGARFERVLHGVTQHAEADKSKAT
jgi:hypothetical protein